MPNSVKSRTKLAAGVDWPRPLRSSATPTPAAASRGRSTFRSSVAVALPATLIPPSKKVANWFPGPLKVQILFALFFTSLPRVPIPSVIAPQSPPARCRFHFQHESAKAETPKPLWTNQILGFSKFRFSGFRVGGDFKGGQPLAWQSQFFSGASAAARIGYGAK